MIEIKDLLISSLEDYGKLKNIINNHLYFNDSIIDELISRFDLNVKRILIEFPYRDFDFSSIYSSFYSKKHKIIPRDCYRLHFFKDESIESNSYCGYLVLRPNRSKNSKGKALIDPKLLAPKGSYLILCNNFESHIFGNQYKINSFPWIAQDTDITRCAHSSSWSIIRYFSQKYTRYQERTLNDIVELVPQYVKRKTPSEGLNLLQISTVLSESGFHPIYLSKKIHSEDFIKNIYIYLESGIPLIAAIETDSFFHTICLIGHGSLNTEKKLAFSNKDYILSHEFIDNLIAVDDNYLPYVEVSNLKKDKLYAIENITHVIVPLYEKMFLPASVVLKKIDYLIESKLLNLKNDLIVRPYLTSSRSLKLRAYENETMNQDLQEIIVKTPMPKFIWCIDFSSENEFKNGLSSARVIIDSTSGINDIDSFLLMHDNKNISYYDYSDGEWHEKISSIKPYNLYKNNLEEV